MYVDTLKIKNLRGFEQAEMRLNYPGRKYPKGVTPPRLQNVNLLLGENGSGKSTVFRALCIGVLRGYLNISRFVSDDNIRHGADKAEVEVSLRLHWSDLMFVAPTRKSWKKDRSEEVEVSSTARIYRRETTEIVEPQVRPKTWDGALFLDTSSSLFLVAYGANRRNERLEAFDRGNLKTRYQRVVSLFEPNVGLTPFDGASFDVAMANRGDEAAGLINKILPQPLKVVPHSVSDASNAFQAFVDEKEWMFDTGFSTVKFSSLSDGHRTFIGWIVDLLSHLTQVLSDEIPLNSMRGVVIVDEVDLLLHPAWQRTVVEKLAITFPNLQFLFSTHSPIVAATLDAANIFVTRAGKIEQYTEPIAGKSIDAALTSPYFRLASPRAPQLERDLNALAEKAMEGDFEASLQYLRLLRTGNDTAAKAGNDK